MARLMVRITVVTVFPELVASWARVSLVERACAAGLIEINTIKLSDFVAPKERIDTPACGPGAGMVLKAPVVAAAIEDACVRYGKGMVITFTPSGTLVTQPFLQEMAARITASEHEAYAPGEVPHLILLCGRYEGVDCRVHEKYAALEVSVGPLVVMGGDVPAQLFLEGLIRLLPGVVGDKDSVEHDSFTGSLVDYPAYGQPVEWEGLRVPEVVLSGDHGRIASWRRSQALAATLRTHFSWLRHAALDDKERKEVLGVVPPHYVVLMHDEVLIGKTDPQPGTTSVTTIDVHDIARSSATYGIKKFFIVTSLNDQHELLRVFFEFWHTNTGKEYNENRYDAMSVVRVVRSRAEAEAEIAAENDGVLPLRVATSARSVPGAPSITYDDQGSVWRAGRPVMLIFGTGQGLTQECLSECHFVLVPVRGFSSYNHLSVRAAVAIILDRWLGYHQPALKGE